MNVLICGATSGVGLELARSLSINPSNQVTGIGRDISKISFFEKSNLSFISCNLEEYDQLEQELNDSNFVPDILINCAATWTGGRGILENDSDFMLQSFKLNYLSAYNSIYYALSKKEFSASNPLRIINLGATASLRGGAGMSAFAVPKSGLRILSESVAREFGKDGVHCVHIVIDGLIDNERTRDLNPGVEDEKYIKTDSLVRLIESISTQDKSCWVNELILRPYLETF